MNGPGTGAELGVLAAELARLGAELAEVRAELAAVDRGVVEAGTAAARAHGRLDDYDTAYAILAQSRAGASGLEARRQRMAASGLRVVPDSGDAR